MGKSYRDKQDHQWGPNKGFGKKKNKKKGGHKPFEPQDDRDWRKSVDQFNDN